MNDVDLLTVSVFAFLAVFALLGALAAMMHALTLLFPAPPDHDDDTSLHTAIISAASAAYPGMHVVSIEEKR
jgi:hypothetical protein